MPKKRYTKSEVLIKIQNYVDKFCGGNKSEAARRFDIHPNEMGEIYRGVRDPSKKVIKVLGFKEKLVKYYENA